VNVHSHMNLKIERYMFFMPPYNIYVSFSKVKFSFMCFSNKLISRVDWHMLNQPVTKTAGDA